MTSWEEAHWEPSMANLPRRERRSGTYRRFLPAELLGAPLVLDPEVDALLARAETAAERDLEKDVLAGVAAKTLILNGQRDPDAASAAATFYRSAIPGARVEMVPAHGAADERLALGDVWDRVLSHCAPHTRRSE